MRRPTPRRQATGGWPATTSEKRRQPPPESPVPPGVRPFLSTFHLSLPLNSIRQNEDHDLCDHAPRRSDAGGSCAGGLAMAGFFCKSFCRRRRRRSRLIPRTRTLLSSLLQSERGQTRRIGRLDAFDYETQPGKERERWNERWETLRTMMPRQLRSHLGLDLFSSLSLFPPQRRELNSTSTRTSSRTTRCSTTTAPWPGTKSSPTGLSRRRTL